MLEEARSTKSWVSLRRRALCRSERGLTDSRGKLHAAQGAQLGLSDDLGEDARETGDVCSCRWCTLLHGRSPQHCNANILQNLKCFHFQMTGRGLGNKAPVGVHFTPTEGPVLSSENPPVLVSSGALHSTRQSPASSLLALRNCYPPTEDGFLKHLSNCLGFAFDPRSLISLISSQKCMWISSSHLAGQWKKERF